jgi:drug efflux transport system permease protein
MLKRLRHMMRKEFIQLLRDPRSRFVLFMPAIVQMIVFGYAATFELRHIPTAVLDRDSSPESRELISRFTSNPYFAVRYHAHSPQEVRSLIDASRVAIAIQIHPGFAALLRKGATAPIQVILDGSNSNTALIALGYANSIAREFALAYQRNRLRRIAPALVPLVPTVALEQRPWFNSTFNSRWYFIPSLIASIVLITVMQLTAFAVVRERELGTLEQVMVTPISRSEFILGKTVPFFILGMVDMVVVASVGTWWFEVPFRGSIGVLTLGTTLFMLSALGTGLLISTTSSTQQQAMITGLFFLVPAISLSGLGTPISSMPEALQWVTYLNPLRHFIVVLRGVYLKGVGVAMLWPEMIAMAMLGVMLLGVSVFRFRKSLD